MPADLASANGDLTWIAGRRTEAKIALAADTLLYDRWFDLSARKAFVDEAQPSPEAAFIASNLISPVAGTHIAALRAIGHLRAPGNLPLLIGSLNDSDISVQIEAVKAIGETLYNTKDDAVAVARKALLTQLSIEQGPRASGNIPVSASPSRKAAEAALVQRVVDQILETLGGLIDDADVETTETLLVTSRSAAGLETLTRHYNQHKFAEGTLVFLRGEAIHGSLRAAEALVNIHDSDVATVIRMVTFNCGDAFDPCTWQVHRLAVMLVDPLNPQFAEALELGAQDLAFQVRWEALQPRLRALVTSQSCAPLIGALLDPAPQIVMHALDLVRASCTEHDELVRQLRSLVSDSLDSQLFSHLLPAIARISPEDATRMLPRAIDHEEWRVRAAAARTAAILRDENTLMVLAADDEPNVRTEVLAGLVAIRSPKRFTTTLQMIDDARNVPGQLDVQLVHAAAEALHGVTDEDVRVRAVKRLLDVLDALTTEGRDTSRDARLAVIERLKELATPDKATIVTLQPYLSDFDPQVASAVADLLQKLTLTRPDPTPTRRPPQQPTLDELFELARHPRAIVTLANGDQIGLQFNIAEAPIAVARFQALIRQGYYNGLSFHRVVTNFVAQGGSPGANEYSGADRFARDEIGAPNIRGAVGLSTRGIDTADMQFFFDLVDLPRLDHEYTIFASVYYPIPAAPDPKGAPIDRILEGARISNIALIGLQAK